MSGKNFSERHHTPLRLRLGDREGGAAWWRGECFLNAVYLDTKTTKDIDGNQRIDSYFHSYFACF